MQKRLQKVKVCAPPRIHMGLIDCGRATDRLYGGAGFSFDGLCTSVSASPAEEWRVEFADQVKHSLRTEDEVDQLISRLEDVDVPPVEITIDKMAPEHVGLGSKTTLLQSVALAAFCARNIPYSKSHIVKLTRRGGASGIGVNTFWSGRLIVDGGHHLAKQDRQFQPSSHRVPDNIPPILARVDMPKDWSVAIFYDPNFLGIEGKREALIFSEVMPVEEIQCLTALSLIYHGVLPSIHEHNLKTLSAAIHDLNNTGMKKIEVSQQSVMTQKCLAAFWQNGLPAGLSSFGPCIYVIGETNGEEIETAKKIATTYALIDLGKYHFRKRGVTIKQS